MNEKLRGILTRFIADYGMIFALLLLCVYFTWATYKLQSPEGASGGDQLAAEIASSSEKHERVLVVVGTSTDDAEFADAIKQRLGGAVIDVVKGVPPDGRAALEKISESGGKLDVIAATQATGAWRIFDGIDKRFPKLAGARVVTAKPYWGSDFLKRKNLTNVADQIVIIAIIAIGMTMVIITGGIDLSVGSLIALSAVSCAMLIVKFGGVAATPLQMTIAAISAIATSALVGLFSGTMVTGFGVPPFIVTLAIMLEARGLARKLSADQSINALPDSFLWLGRGTNLGLSNGVLMMILLYATAHVMMTRTTLGRYIYAVGGNQEVARLSGVPVRRILLLVYAICGASAGLGGIVLASQLQSGDPKYGNMYELYVIAAAVVGGTSLSGGEGKILGTLIGAFIIAVMRNGMNLTGIQDESQMCVMGAVILGAVLLDKLKRNKGLAAMFRLIVKF